MGKFFFFFNVLYKIMGKMIANRMKDVLNHIISKSQSVFVPDRLITNNILVAAEAGHYLRRKQNGRVRWAGLKLDMAKAYDRMEWSYLRRMMLALGFDVKWVNLVMHCVTTVNYKVRVNGQLTKTITPTRGIRQGDPLSPYLFIICAEGLSLLLQTQEMQGRISGLKVARRAPAISHLFFANDILLFFKATPIEANLIKEVLWKYEVSSGQTVNFNKSTITLSENMHRSDKLAIANLLGVTEAVDFGKYLGLPSVIGRDKKKVFHYILEKIGNRVGSWSKRFVTKARRQILLKTMAQAMPTYTMSIYLLPMTFCEDIEKLFNRFWWKGKNERGRGIHWLAWDKLCTPKKYGGLGFKQVHNFNLALVGKQGWRLLTSPDCLMARVLKAKYYEKENSFLSAKLRQNASYAWKSIMASPELLRSRAMRRIGDGESTLVWEDPWLPRDSKPTVDTLRPSDLMQLKVCHFINEATGTWSVEKGRELLLDRDFHLM